MSDDEQRYRKLAPLDFTLLPSRSSSSPFSIASFNRLLDNKEISSRATSLTSNAGQQNQEIQPSTSNSNAILLDPTPQELSPASSHLNLSPPTFPPLASSDGRSTAPFNGSYHEHDSVRESSHCGGSPTVPAPALLSRADSPPATDIELLEPVYRSALLWASRTGEMLGDESVIEMHGRDEAASVSPGETDLTDQSDPTSNYGELLFIMEDPKASNPSPSKPLNWRTAGARVRTRKTWGDAEKNTLRAAVELWKSTNESDAVDWDWVYDHLTKQPGFRRGKAGMLTMASKEFGRETARSIRRASSTPGNQSRSKQKK